MVAVSDWLLQLAPEVASFMLCILKTAVVLRAGLGSLLLLASDHRLAPASKRQPGGATLVVSYKYLLAVLFDMMYVLLLVV